MVTSIPLPASYRRFASGPATPPVLERRKFGWVLLSTQQTVVGFRKRTALCHLANTPIIPSQLLGKRVTELERRGRGQTLEVNRSGVGTGAPKPPPQQFGVLFSPDPHSSHFGWFHFAMPEWPRILQPLVDRIELIQGRLSMSLDVHQ
ncbi:hypothetical protein E2320_011783, partial [Naja naja]